MVSILFGSNSVQVPIGSLLSVLYDLKTLQNTHPRRDRITLGFKLGSSFFESSLYSVTDHPSSRPVTTFRSASNKVFHFHRQMVYEVYPETKFLLLLLIVLLNLMRKCPI